MEIRISRFVKGFAVFLAFWFALLAIDEILSPVKVNTRGIGAYYKESNTDRKLIYDYFIELEGEKDFQISRFVFDSLSPNEEQVILYKTPVFKQAKGLDIKLRRNHSSFSFGEPNSPRTGELLTSLLIVVLALLSAFVLKRFEYRISAFFFAAIFAAVRWWFMGI